MFSFDEQYKKFEELAERTKQAYEFWYNCLVSTWQDFTNQRNKPEGPSAPFFVVLHFRHNPGQGVS
jgi:hypothetical protein